MRVVFFGTSAVALPSLQALADSHQILAAVTAPDAKSGRRQTLTPSPVAQSADSLGLTVLKPGRVKGNTALLQELSRLNADVFIVISYGKILPTEIINLPRLKTLNIHFSRLPQYRGASPIQFALLNGEEATATTIFILEETLDTGPVLAQEEAVINPDDTFASLAPRLAEQSARLLVKILPLYESGFIIPRPQNPALATYTKTLTKQDGQIDWAQDAHGIYDRWRAFTPWPGVWTKWEGKIIKVLECTPLTTGEDTGPGTVLAGGIVACGNGTSLQISRLQLEGKSAVDIKTFINGYQNFTGSKLGLYP
jgi:methionyl-tRNA formyltransferase